MDAGDFFSFAHAEARGAEKTGKFLVKDLAAGQEQVTAIVAGMVVNIEGQVVGVRKPMVPRMPAEKCCRIFAKVNSRNECGQPSSSRALRR